MKVIFLNNWGESPKSVLERLTFQTKNHNGIWNDIVGTDNINEADYYIILDGYTGHNSLDKSKKIFLQREPPCIFTNREFTDGSNVLFFGNYTNQVRVATWMLRKKFSDLENLKIPSTFKKISTVTSNKQSTEGHRLRLKLINNLKRELPTLDLYGKGFKPLVYDKYCKFNGLYGYEYSIAIENWNGNNSVTEKMIDCILCWSKPIYWGCPNISSILPPESYTYVDIHNPNCHKMILEEIKKPVNYSALKEARNIILHKLNIWPSIESIIKSSIKR